MKRWVIMLGLAMGLAAQGKAQGLPGSGVPVPELQAFEDALVQFMATNSIKAGALGIMKDGVVVYERAFGWEDAPQTVPVRPDVLMRLASVTKPITAAGIQRLIAAGLLAEGDFVFDLGQPGGGVLAIPPFATPDVRLQDITVKHCLDHKGGWDRDIAGDLTYRELVIANAMGVPSPPGRSNTVSWIMGQPLQTDPGATYAYSNIGFLLLGMVLESVSGEPYLSYVQREVFDPIGVAAGEFGVGRTFAVDRDPREPWYDSLVLNLNVFFPAHHGTAVVFAPNGGWDHEARVGQGALIASTRTLLRFLDTYYISGPNIGKLLPPTLSTGFKRNHTGSLAGTDTLARQRGDGVNYAVLFNKRPLTGSSYASQVRTLIDGLIDSATNWPSVDPGSLPAAPVELELFAGMEMGCLTETGRVYAVEVSRDGLATWEREGAHRIGDDGVQRWPLDPGAGEAAYRLRVQ